MTFPDFPKLDPTLEDEVLADWQRTEAFARLRRRNEGNTPFSFLDGPLTANNPMGVHHVWGRTLKDLFQRYQAMRGYDQRYQNGFDCQGLWLEVEVEKELGFSSKREVESYGLARFAARCRERVARFAAKQSEQSKRLGMWMDWGRDYYTFSDANQEANWRFLKHCHENNWLYQGERVMAWCPRCGTTLSEHEQTGSYQLVTHPEAYVRFPLESDLSLVAWTTTPWSLLGNRALAVRAPDDYALVDSAAGPLAVLAARLSALPKALQGPVLRRLKGQELVGLEYALPYPSAGDDRGRVVAWSEVSDDEGTGVVHVAPGAGPEDFLLGQAEGLLAFSPLDEEGRVVRGLPFAGLESAAASQAVLNDLAARGLLVHEGRVRHRYPVCWRCKSALVHRLVKEWFVAVDELRPRLRAAAATVSWQPEHEGKRMDDWLENMRDWCVSRKRYYGLPLPFYPCECGRLTVVSSRAELRERAVDPALVDQLPELHRPYVDEVLVRCDCGRAVKRVPEVGDVWLDAGVVPLSTLGFANERTVPAGLGTGAAQGLTTADLPAAGHFARWFPADFVCEMREQTRLWFYATLFTSVALVGRAPYRRVLAYERVVGESGEKMSKTGQTVSLDDVAAKEGADALRFLYARTPLTQQVAYGPKALKEAKAYLLLVWNSATFLASYGRGFAPTLADLETPEVPEDEAHPLDRWLAARMREATVSVSEALERFDAAQAARELERYSDELSTFYLRASRERLKHGDRADLVTFWRALVRLSQLSAPLTPFLAESLYRRLVRDVCPGAQDSVFLLPWPEDKVSAEDREALTEAQAVRAVLEAGRSARQHRLRQPVREARLELEAETLARYGDVLAAELNADSLASLRRDELAALEQAGYALARAHDRYAAVDVLLDDELLARGRRADALALVQQARKQARLKVGEEALLLLGREHERAADLLALDAADLRAAALSLELVPGATLAAQALSKATEDG